MSNPQLEVGPSVVTVVANHAEMSQDEVRQLWTIVLKAPAASIKAGQGTSDDQFTAVHTQLSDLGHPAAHWFRDDLLQYASRFDELRQYIEQALGDDVEQNIEYLTSDTLYRHDAARNAAAAAAAATTADQQAADQQAADQQAAAKAAQPDTDWAPHPEDPDRRFRYRNGVLEWDPPVTAAPADPNVKPTAEDQAKTEALLAEMREKLDRIVQLGAESSSETTQV